MLSGVMFTLLIIVSGLLAIACAWLLVVRDRLMKARIQAEVEVQMLKEALTVERQRIDTTKTAMQDAFRSLAAQSLEGNSRQFLQLAKSELEKETLKANSTLSPLLGLLDKYQERLNEIEKDRQRTHYGLESEIGKLMAATTALKNALKKPHVRGRWGEVQLKNCIELAGMSEYCDVHLQKSYESVEGDRLIPDMTVRMPGGRVVFVDAKTPLEAFLNSLEAPTEEAKTAEMARHGSLLKEHVLQLAKKDYARQIKETADFTVMFLPNESFLYGALECQPDLIEFALQRKVLIATPPTLIGLLKVILYGWNEERLARNAQMISEAGQELHRRVVDFVDSFSSIGKHLDKAKEAYETGRMRLESRVLKQTRKLEELGAKSNKDLVSGASEQIV